MNEKLAKPPGGDRTDTGAIEALKPMMPPTPDPKVEEIRHVYRKEVGADGISMLTAQWILKREQSLLQRLTELTAEREHWESILSDHQLALTEARDELKAAQQTIASLKDVLCTLHDAVVRHGCNETDSWPVTFKAQMDALHTTKDLLASLPAGPVPGDI